MVSLAQKLKLPPLDGMAVSAEGQRKLKAKERLRSWAKLHKDRISEYGRRYYRKHCADITARRSTADAKAKKAAWSKRYQSTPEYRARRAAMYRANPEPIRARIREAAKTPEGRRQASEYQKRRRRENPQVHFLNWLRGSINRSLRKQHAAKGGRTEWLVGCTFQELRSHLESQFPEGCSWNARCRFDVDHIVPVSAFDLTDTEEQRCAFNYKNMRPLDRMENKQKAATIPNPLPSWLPTHIAERINARRQARTASTSPFLTSLSLPVVSQSNGVPT